MLALPHRLIALTGLAMAVCAGSAFSAPPENAAVPQGLFSYQNIDRAWGAATKTNRPLLLFVSMNNCAFCDKMEVDTYAHPEIKRGIDELFITVKMKKEDNPELIKQLGVRAYPTTLLIAPSGSLIAKIEGYADPKKFVTSIRPALAAHDQGKNRTATLPKTDASAAEATDQTLRN